MATLAELQTKLTEVEAAIGAIINENASTVIFEGRTIIRPDLNWLTGQRAQLQIKVNELIAYDAGESYIWGRTVEYQ